MHKTKFSKNGRKLSVIIPCYNEKKYISALIEAVKSAPWHPKEIIVVDDGSTDGTSDILQSLDVGEGRIIHRRRNHGKGAAIRAAMQYVTGDIIIIQDADLEYDPSEYPRMIAPIIEGRAEVVYGSRFTGSEPHRILYFWHRLGNGLLTHISNMFTNLNLTDMETCYKAFRRDILQSITIEENRFGFEPEITAKIARSGCRIYEVGISYHGRTYREGKKISWKDGIRALYCIIRYNLF